LDGEAVSLSEVVAGWTEENPAVIAGRLRRLSFRERRVLEGSIEGRTLASLAKEFDVTQERIWHVFFHALKKLQ